MGVIIAATGGDRQEHVSVPLDKLIMKQNSLIQANKARRELETIEENHKEEEYGLSQAKIEQEETYSFSVRKFHADK